ncbi:MAG: CoA-binding protein, partial [Rickettsiales bacterium]|nr:CoA-binding protein [Rickettsiales bacterium]
MAKEKIVNIENEPVCVSEECRAISMFMHPKNIAIVGASNTPGKPGNATMVNLLAAGFEGGIYPVHPRSSSILSVPAFKSVYALPVVPDLGIIVVPAPAVPGVVEEFGKKGTRAVVVISADMNQKADDGRTLSQIMMSHAKKYKIRIVGPNCIGVQSPYSKVNGSFMCSMAAAGHIGLISQSGALAASGVDWAKANGIGFSHIFSIGDQADVDISDLVEFLTVQEECAAIVIYMESIKDPERFVHASQRAAIRKPVFCLKAGRSASAQKAAASHTGALATGDEFYETLFRRAGVQRVDNFQEVFSRASIAGYHLAAKSRKLTILTNGGGSGILAVDRLASLGGELAELHADTIEKLSKVLPAGWSHLNPVDIVGDAPGNRYADALNILKHAPEVDTVFTIFGPTSITSSLDVAERLVEVVKRHNFKNLY